MRRGTLQKGNRRGNLKRKETEKGFVKKENRRGTLKKAEIEEGFQRGSRGRTLQKKEIEGLYKREIERGFTNRGIVGKK